MRNEEEVQKDVDTKRREVSAYEAQEIRTGAKNVKAKAERLILSKDVTLNVTEQKEDNNAMFEGVANLFEANPHSEIAGLVKSAKAVEKAKAYRADNPFTPLSEYIKAKLQSTGINGFGATAAITEEEINSIANTTIATSPALKTVQASQNEWPLVASGVAGRNLDQHIFGNMNNLVKANPVLRSKIVKR